MVILLLFWRGCFVGGGFLVVAVAVVSRILDCHTKK